MFSSRCLQGTKAFLPKNDAGAIKPGGFPLQAGCLIECVVAGAKDRRMLSVTADPSLVSSAVTKEWNGMTIGEMTSYSS